MTPGRRGWIVLLCVALYATAMFANARTAYDTYKVSQGVLR